SGGREFRVTAYDLLHRLRKNGSVRAHIQVTLNDLAHELAASQGLTVQGHESPPLMQYIIQHRQSDLELLQELAERTGLYLAVREDTLHIFSLTGIEGNSLTLMLGDTLLEASVQVNADGVVGEVAAAGWDTARIEAHTGRINSARSGRSVDASVSAGDVGGAGSVSLIDLGVEDAAQTEALAQAELDRRTAQQVTFRGTAQGDTRLRPGAHVEIKAIAPSIAGIYVLTQVTHTINQQVGYISELSSELLPVRIRPRSTIATPAVVTQIDDPEGLGRVRVALPSFENVNTDWINVVSLGAGSGKGLMIQPDVNDDVLVLLAHEDPAQAVVVGGLYGPHGTPDSGIVEGAVKRYSLVTPGGQKIKLDDSGQVIRLENSDGSFIELSPEKVTVHAMRDLQIEAPGKAIIILGSTIDFQKG
ncbi:MAG: phage baseplate assembly protein V, partial [Chloroflexota bacterium]